MAQLRTLTLVPKDPDSNLSTHRNSQFQEIQCPLLASIGTAHIQCTNTTCRKETQIKGNKSLKKIIFEMVMSLAWPITKKTGHFVE